MKIQIKLIVLVLLAFTSFSILADSKSRVDKALLDASEKAKQPLIDSLRSYVEIESGSNNREGLLKIANLYEANLKSLGFKTERQASLVGTKADIVTGVIKGKGQLKLMLISHMDTVYPKGTIETQPYKILGNKIYGPGIADDKAGMAVIIHSLQILFKSGWNDFDSITVICNPDEEVGSIGSGGYIQSMAKNQDIVLSFEPSDDKKASGFRYAGVDPLILATSGAARVSLTVYGRGSHTGAAPENGRNALLELAHELLITRDLPKKNPGATLNWVQAISDGPQNQIPEKASAIGDIRIPRDGAELKLVEMIRETISKDRLVPDTSSEVTLIPRRPSYRADKRAMEVVAIARSIYQEINLHLAEVGTKENGDAIVGGGTDAGFASRSGAIVIEGLGLPGYGYHAKDEYVLSDTIVPRLYLATRLISILAKNGVPTKR